MQSVTFVITPPIHAKEEEGMENKSPAPNLGLEGIQSGGHDLQLENDFCG
jgi:hypothetical protein